MLNLSYHLQQLRCFVLDTGGSSGPSGPRDATNIHWDPGDPLHPDDPNAALMLMIGGKAGYDRMNDIYRRQRNSRAGLGQVGMAGVSVWLSPFSAPVAFDYGQAGLRQAISGEPVSPMISDGSRKFVTAIGVPEEAVPYAAGGLEFVITAPLYHSQPKSGLSSKASSRGTDCSTGTRSESAFMPCASKRAGLSD